MSARDRAELEAELKQLRELVAATGYELDDWQQEMLSVIFRVDEPLDGATVRRYRAEWERQLQAGPPARPDKLPWLCRLRGHGWQRSTFLPGGWMRTTCHRCIHLDPRRRG